MARCLPAASAALLLSCCSLFLAVAPRAHAAPPEPGLLREANELRDRALGESDAWQHAWSLTTEVGPRPAGSAGDRAAVTWALTRLADIGFDEIRPQPVEVSAWERGTAEVRVTAPFPQPLVATALGRSVGTPEGGIEAPVVRFESLAALEAAKPEEVRGRIVFIDERMERQRDGSGYSPAVQKRSSGPAVAARRGAAALVIRSVGTSTHRFAHTGATRYAEDVRPIPAFALSNPDADLVTAQFASGEEVRLHLYSSARELPPTRSANVIADIRGADKPDEIVIMGAHLDSWDLGTGAQDNATGVAILMETARFIAMMPRRPARTVRIVLYANEERGLDGSRTYTGTAMQSEQRHVIGIEADGGGGLIYRLDSGVDEKAFPVIEAMRKVLAPLGIEGGDNSANGGADLSTLRAEGMPVLSLRHDMSAYFDIHHTANDTLDKVDPEALKQAVAAYASVVWIAANVEDDFGATVPNGSD
jgi:hypothetical protein